MADSFNQDDDLRRLKDWWQSNGLSLIVGAVVGLAIIGGWQGWRIYGNREARDAATLYQTFDQALTAKTGADKLDGLAGRLQSAYPGSPYATAAALTMGHYYAAREDYKKAIEQLQWVTDNGGQAPLRQLARVRQARLLWAQGDDKGALAALAHKHPQAFDTLYSELTGDIHAAAGDNQKARMAYQEALENLPPDADPTALKQKLDDVSSAAKTADAS